MSKPTEDSARHSPVPWRVELKPITFQPGDAMAFIRDATGKSVTIRIADDRTLGDFRRIVACVNACEGVGTKTLESKPALIAVDPMYLSKWDRLGPRMLDCLNQLIAEFDTYDPTEPQALVLDEAQRLVAMAEGGSL